MKIIVQTNKEYINGEHICNVLKLAGMGTHTPEKHKKAFENSFRFALLFDEDANSKLIGCGRIISDGCYQGAVYDIALLPEYQGHQLGKLILDSLLKDLEGINLILYATPGKESFYEKFGFRKAKTAMLKFVLSEQMREKGYTE